MSNTLAIGAVTATLRNLLDQAIAEEGGGMHATTMAPEKAQIFGQADGQGRINLFLYQTQINAAWRNMDMPGQIKPNETGRPPLALDLYYLLTAYGARDLHAEAMPDERGFVFGDVIGDVVREKYQLVGCHRT